MLICGMMCAACKESPSYDDALSEMENVESYEVFVKFVFETEGRVSSAAATCYGDTLPNEFIASRDSFYTVIDRRLAEFKKGHFVQLRTVLYENAAAIYPVVEAPEGVNAVNALLKRWSAAVYIDGQRVGDPPLAVRERYEQAKEKAQNAFEQAKASDNMES